MYEKQYVIFHFIFLLASIYKMLYVEQNFKAFFGVFLFFLYMMITLC